MKFLGKKGFDHLFKIYFMIEDNDLSSVFNCKVTATLIKFINFYLEQ